jgi:uncharacterized membrane protein YgdD (TMEM256/DUF423 family)
MKRMSDDGSVQLRQIASLLGATGVGFGAFGAHALKKTLSSKVGATENWKTAVYYQLFHSVAVLTLSALHQQNFQNVHESKNTTTSSITNSYQLAGQLMGIGSVLFAGSIYLLTLDIGPRKLLGPTTPIGGLLMIAGWVVVGMAK